MKKAKNMGPAMVLLSALAAILLAACASSPRMNLKEDFGNAVRSNAAMQVIDPGVGEPQPTATTLDGQKAEKGMERYYAGSGAADTERLIEGSGGGE